MMAISWLEVPGRCVGIQRGDSLVLSDANMTEVGER